MSGSHQAPLIDTHCHLNVEQYDLDRGEIIARAASNGVTAILNPATDLSSGTSVLTFAEKYPGIYAAVGIHPHRTASFNPDDIQILESQAAFPKVLAIGEIGLDYYRDWSPKDQQRTAFEQQLALAARLELPVIIHNREASDDILAILCDWVPTLPPALHSRPGVLHSFSAPRYVAEKALDLGFYLSFSGPITFKNADTLRSIAASVPLDRLLVETDGPFLAPEPHRGKRNEPAYVRFVADRLAALRNISDAELDNATTENACRLFQIER